jgi:site-specific DNA-adenine methylase
MFLDPSYYLENKSKLYWNNGDLHQDFNHDLLFDLLNTKKTGLSHIIIVNILEICIKIL